MLDYLCRKEKILTAFKSGLINKGHLCKLTGLNARLDTIRDIKSKLSIEMLNNIAEITNYPIVLEVLHGIDNIYRINTKKNNWYLFAINKIDDTNIDIIRESYSNNECLIYRSEKSIGGKFTEFIVIFSQHKYNGSHEYINQKWQVK